MIHCNFILYFLAPVATPQAIAPASNRKGGDHVYGEQDHANHPAHAPDVYNYAGR